MLLLKLGLSAGQLTNKSFHHLWSLGYGTVTSESMIGFDFPGSSGLMRSVLIANLPQVILSFLFLTYNSLFTCMLLAQEWASYAQHRKPLRVTSPTGHQRSTYRLQLPYRYGAPLLITSGILHWLVSQSLFLARVTAFSADGTEESSNSVSSIGYSCIAIITVIILGLIVVLLGLVNGARWYKGGVPFVGSCSAAISAACHPSKGDLGVGESNKGTSTGIGIVKASQRGVMWGVIPGIEEHRGIGHCCFSAGPVDTIIEGKIYA